MKAAARRCCVFCDSPADSREQVFAKRLCKRAGAVRFPVIPGTFTEGKGTRTRNQHHLEALQVRHVYARNGRSRIGTRFRPGSHWRWASAVLV
jgi:hypothetical protein